MAKLENKIKELLPVFISKKIKYIKYVKTGYSRHKWAITLKDGKQLFLRVSEKREKTYSLKKEAYVCNLLRKNGIPAPQVIKLGEFVLNDKRYEYLITSFLKGLILEKKFSSMPKKEQCKALYQVGLLLGKMHNIHFKKFGNITEDGEIVSDEKVLFKTVMNRYKVHGISWEWLIFSKVFASLGVLMACKVIDKAYINKVINFLKKYEKIFINSGQPTFVHNDFKLAHVFLDQKMKLSGIIDIELAVSYPKEYDFIFLHRMGIFDNAFLLNCLLKGYKKHQKISKDFRLRVIVYRLIYELRRSKTTIKSEGIAAARKKCKNTLKMMNKYHL